MSNIKIISQYIKDLSFELPSAPQAFLTPQDKPDISLSIDIDAKKISDELYEVTLKILADAKIKGEKFFLCEISYAGLFSLQKIEAEMLEQILLIYCPNLLFPFLRRIVSNLTTDGGLAPLMLDPIDFAALYARRKAVSNSEPVSNTKN
jgi:preprotein translocase subunit SecB